MVQAYAEVHFIKGSPGEVTDVGIFSDNADKTVFKFLEAFELGYSSAETDVFRHPRDFSSRSSSF